MQGKPCASRGTMMGKKRKRKRERQRGREGKKQEGWEQGVTHQIKMGVAGKRWICGVGWLVGRRHWREPNPSPVSLAYPWDLSSPPGKVQEQHWWNPPPQQGPRAPLQTSQNPSMWGGSERGKRGKGRAWGEASRHTRARRIFPSPPCTAPGTCCPPPTPPSCTDPAGLGGGVREGRGGPGGCSWGAAP